MDYRGIGWLNLDTINIDQATGALTGYAWSSNIGWIKFGGLSNFPSGGTDAVLDWTTGKITGFARACAGTINASPRQDEPGDCSTMTGRTDGWDGWIELSGTNHLSLTGGNMLADAGNTTTGVQMDVKTGSTTGMAWGDENVGWTQFQAGIASFTPTSLTVTCDGVIESNRTVYTAIATGGSSNNAYYWNGSATASSSSKYYLAYSGSGPSPSPTPSTIQVKVVDLASGLSQNASCTSKYPSNPLRITGLCTRIPNNVGGLYNLGDTIKFYVSNITGGTGSYQQTKWWAVAGKGYVAYNDPDAPSPYNATQYTPPSYTSPLDVSQTSVQVKDTSGNLGTILCGPVHISDPANNLTLGIGGDVNGAMANTSDDNTKTSGPIKIAEHRIKQGSKASIAWDNEFNGAGDVCTSNNVTNFSNWVASIVPVGSNVKNYSGTDTKNIPTGSYIFNIKCYKLDGHGNLLTTPSADKTVKLIITSSSEGER